MNKIVKSNDEWKRQLAPEVYHVTREKGTERPFSGQYVDNKEPGTYSCSNCGHVLFTAERKFDSGSGWPSFCAPMNSDALEYKEDSSALTKRTEVLCARCNAHLGHVFNDGPAPTGKRYCINSLALGFKPE